MRLRVISSNSTYYWSVTNAAPAKPYLQISNQYLPLTTATISGVKFKVQSGNTSYRACVYQSGYYNTTSSAVGNLSSTTALTRSSTSGYKTTTSASNFQTTGLINTVTAYNKSTIGRSLSVSHFTVSSFTNNTVTVSRMAFQTGGATYIGTYQGDLQFHPITQNATNILNGCACITGTRSNDPVINISSTYYGNTRTLYELITCSNGHTYKTFTTTNTYTQSGIDTYKSISMSTGTNPIWTVALPYGYWPNDIGTTSGTTSGYVYFQTNVGGYASSSYTSYTSKTTVYSIVGSTSQSGPAWSQSYTWQTTWMRITTSSNGAYTTYNFSYRWDWYSAVGFIDMFTTGNVTSTRKQTVTTSTLTCSSTSGYSGKLSSSKWA